MNIKIDSAAAAAPNLNLTERPALHRQSNHNSSDCGTQFYLLFAQDAELGQPLQLLRLGGLLRQLLWGPRYTALLPQQTRRKRRRKTKMSGAAAGDERATSLRTPDRSSSRFNPIMVNAPHEETPLEEAD
ncbi:hypothetical protein EYF80_005478 [Liparis tanakae]|uniref:Uncharacterized protein n=1 Tax=Liparis tanakae TaxID=230148 RepID=A0A4Z2J2H6_9TELE|nr:hypothetical protein EYF80_005478 [Liparis tanakae]